MAFLNALGRVSRRGQWRLRLPFRAADATGRADLTEDGRILFDNASDIVLTVSPRPPFGRSGGRCTDVAIDANCDPVPVLSASLSAGTLSAWPGLLEVVWPAGWSRSTAPGLYDVRIAVTVGPETAVIFDQPVEVV